MKKQVLLTNVYAPHERLWGSNPLDITSSRLARGHGIYDTYFEGHAWGLHLIAENISHPCVVMEHAHWGEFVDEVRKKYDVIGIQLLSLHTPKVARMVRLIRMEAPDSKIVIGGYGVPGLFDVMPGDSAGDAEYIRQNVDHLCREEGVRFMRRLLEDVPLDRPITQYHLPMVRATQQYPFKVQMVRPVVLVSLGCPSGCDFCATSACFKRRKICVADPGEIYEFMKNHQRRVGQQEISVQLYDEDIFLKPEFVRELGRLIRSDKKTWALRWKSFGSVRALSHFEPEELRECGVGGVWVGIESALSDHRQSKSGYAKREGTMTAPDVIAGLQRCGIDVIGSLILGFDFHTPDNIEQDIDAFISLKPTFYQIAPLCPCPGTALYKRMLSEGRLREDYNWNDVHLWQDKALKRKHFERGDIKHFYDLAHEKIRTLLGPPIVQIFENNIAATETFGNATTDFRRFQANLSRRIVHKLWPAMEAIKNHPPSPEVRRRIKQLQQRAFATCGRDSWKRTPLNIAAQMVANWRIDRAEVPDAEQERTVDFPATWHHYDGSGNSPIVNS